MRISNDPILGRNVQHLTLFSGQKISLFSRAYSTLPRHLYVFYSLALFHGHTALGPPSCTKFLFISARAYTLKDHRRRTVSGPRLGVERWMGG